MRVLLIGQKIVTLEDLNSYFFENNIHGYVSAGAPNILSLDIVRQCGIHMIICQTPDYTMEHLLTFMNKVKEHNPNIVTLLVTDLSELTKIKESMLDLIDDFILVPFSPSEFHTRLIKLISKSTSPQSKVSAEERLKSILSLMTDHPDLNGVSYTDLENDFYGNDDDFFMPNTDLLNSKSPKSDDRDQIEDGKIKVSECFHEDNITSDIDVLDKNGNVSELGSLEAQVNAYAGLTPSEYEQTNVGDTDKAADRIIHSNAANSDLWTSSRFAELIDGIDFDKEPILSELRKQKLTIKSFNDIQTSENNQMDAIRVDTESVVIQDDSDSIKNNQLDNESRESGFNKFLESFGRLIYLLLIFILLLFSIVVIKSYYDGGIATFSDYGIYSNTGKLQNENPNLMRSSYPGALIVTSGVRPDTIFGDQVLFVLPWLGYIVDYAKTPFGFLLIVVAPLLLIFSIEIYYWTQRRKFKHL